LNTVDTLAVGVAYERDARGNIVHETRHLRTSEGQLKMSTIDYQYDAMGQLVSETGSM